MPRGKLPVDARRYRVTSGIPIPSLYNPDQFPLRRMKVGDSFGFPADEQGRVRNAIGRYRKGGAKSTRFVIRTEGKDRCRCWRVA